MVDARNSRYDFRCTIDLMQGANKRRGSGVEVVVASEGEAKCQKGAPEEKPFFRLENCFCKESDTHVFYV